ncbi:gp032 [Rhodococcus phage ReqiPoco6]|uniref:Gp032 n=1 Tax=Rhodococcus phage ReqiPoco6 TaxID=691964 RepID=D4P7Q0_9CAUD|nr:gp032 [Rhodococcus phage ReqiPoco6]ADD81030.1 gp032 [Rhodococcus phage ReqiPoco6]
MAQVTVRSLTAERMIEIEQSAIVSGVVQGDILILVTKAGANITAGNVRGPKGDKGVKGDTGAPGGVQIGGNIGGTLSVPKVTGVLDNTVNVTSTFAKGMYDDGRGGGPVEISMSMADILTTLLNLNAESVGAVKASGKTKELWTGTQAEWNALPTATRNAPGFVAVIVG